MVVRARSKAHLSVATEMAGDEFEEDEGKEIQRPKSAPITSRESNRAKKQVRSGTVLQRHISGKIYGSLQTGKIN